MAHRLPPAQARRLAAWAQAWPERAWAVEGATGLGHLLAQQLVAAGEQVLDVPAELAARVRLLEAGDVNKNDPDPRGLQPLELPGAQAAGLDRRVRACDRLTKVAATHRTRVKDLVRRLQPPCRDPGLTVTPHPGWRPR